MRLKRALSAKPMNQGAIATGNRLLDSLRDAPPLLRIFPASKETKSVLGHFRRGKSAYLGAMKLRDLAYPLGWTSPRRIS